MCVICSTLQWFQHIKSELGEHDYSFSQVSLCSIFTPTCSANGGDIRQGIETPLWREASYEKETRRWVSVGNVITAKRHVCYLKSKDIIRHVCVQSVLFMQVYKCINMIVPHGLNGSWHGNRQRISTGCRVKKRQAFASWGFTRCNMFLVLQLNWLSSSNAHKCERLSHSASQHEQKIH